MHPRSTPSVETWYGWVVIGASLLIHTVSLAAPTILFVVLKPLAAEFETPRAMVAMAYSLLMIGAGGGGVIMGLWMDRRGVFQPVLFGSCMVALGAFVASRADSPLTLYLATGVFMGLLGKAAMIAPLVANATRWFDRRRGLAVAIIASGQGFAGALWPPIIHAVNSAWGWRETFMFFSLLALVIMVPLTLVLRREPPAPPPAAATGRAGEDGRVLGLAPRAVQLMLWAAVVGCCTAMAVPIVHLVSHATDLGAAPRRAAEMLSLLFVAAFVSRIAFGMLADRVGAMPTLLVGSACQAATLLLLAWVDTVAGLYVGALLFGLGFSGIMPCYALILRNLFPVHQAGWRIASQFLFGALGMALGGWLGGAVYDLTGSYQYAFLAGAAFNVANLAIMSSLFLRARRFAASPAAA